MKSMESTGDLLGIVELAGPVEGQHTSKEFRISIEEVLIENIVIEELLLVGAEHRVWVFVERVPPGLEAMSTHVDSYTDVGSHQRVVVSPDRSWRYGTVSERHPPDRRRSHERQPSGHRRHSRRSLSRTHVEALLKHISHHTTSVDIASRRGTVAW